MKADIRFGVLVPAILILSACGGGGISSTPAPPTSGPTPSPSPTPSPTPTPPPTTANADLLNLTKSETFTNDGVTGSASYPNSGTNGTTSSAKATIGIVYDAATKTYTITNGSRSRAFASGTIDGALSNSKQNVFKIVNGSTTDTLTLNKPGTSGALTYKYVGAGFWQRTTTGSSNTSGTFDAFTYGVETPDAAVPRSGNANYSIDLQGTAAYLDEPTSILGAGNMLVRFDTGAIDISGEANETIVRTGVTNGPFGFFGSALLASNRNSFAGKLTLNNLGGLVDSGDSLFGRFYGPNAEEVGAAWFLRTVDGVSAAGTITGRAKASANLNNPASYQIDDAHTLESEVDSNGNLLTFLGNTARYYPQQFQVGGSGFAFRISDPFRSAQFASGDRVAAESNATYSVYKNTAGGVTNKLKLFNSGTANPAIKLTYSSFGIWTDTRSGSAAGRFENVERYFLYGQPTDQQFIPASGSASYGGIVVGTGYGSGGATQNIYNVGGTFQLGFNFADGSFNGLMNGNLRNVNGGTLMDLPEFSLSGQNARFGRFAGQLSGTGSFGGFSGGFFGSNLDEIAAIFQTGANSPFDLNEQLFLQGAILGKKCPSSATC